MTNFNETADDYRAPWSPKLKNEETSVKPVNPHFTGTTTSVKNTGNINHVSNPTVKQMQSAIQDLSRTVSGEQFDPETHTLISKNTNFNSFIGHHYVDTTDKPKEQNPDEPNAPVVITPTSNIMNSISLLDNNKSFTADGVWGPKTDQALNNIYKFAYSLLQLAGDFGLSDNKTYNSTWLNSFHNKLTDYSFVDGKILISADEQTSHATSIIPHINAISRFYKELKQEVALKPELRSHIEDKTPFENYNETGLNLTPAEQAFSQQDSYNIQTMPYAAPKQPNQRLDYVPMKSLVSKDAYMQWMLNYAGVPTEAEAIKIFNSFIKPKVEES